MNTATKNLEDDHIFVLLLTDVMEAVTKTGNPDTEHIESIIDIIRNFADGLHHAKEEDLLFPLLGKKGFSAQQGPVAVMLNEHTIGRSYVKGIAENLLLVKSGNNTALSEVYRNMKAYAELLRNHISKENNILFRMADKTLSENEQENLLAEFGILEQERPAGKRATDYIDRINTLATFYKVQ